MYILNYSYNDIEKIGFLSQDEKSIIPADEIFNKVGIKSPKDMNEFIQMSNDDVISEIIKIINNFENTIKESALKYEPSLISKAVMTLSKNFNKFYHEYKIIDSDASVTQARIQLVKTTKTALKLGLELLGISVVEEM